MSPYQCPPLRLGHPAPDALLRMAVEGNGQTLHKDKAAVTDLSDGTLVPPVRPHLFRMSIDTFPLRGPAALPPGGSSRLRKRDRRPAALNAQSPNSAITPTASGSTTRGCALMAALSASKPAKGTPPHLPPRRAICRDRARRSRDRSESGPRLGQDHAHRGLRAREPRSDLHHTAAPQVSQYP
jgi:hypothetical protein